MKRLLLILLLMTPCLAHAQEPAARPQTDPAVAEAELQRILSDPEFVNATKPGFAEQLGQWLYAWLDSMDTDLRAYEFIGQLTRISYVMMWLILIGSFLALGYWSFRVFKRRRWQETEEEAAHTIGELITQGDDGGPSVPLNSGQSTVRRMLSRWRDFLHRLEERHVTPPLDALTNREALKQLPEPDPQLDELASAYDRHVFGHHPLDDAAARKWLEELDAAEHRLAATRGAAS